MVNNGTKMAVYDEVKQGIKKLDVLNPKGVPISLASATVAGLFMTLTVAPFDMVRGRARGARRRDKEPKCATGLRSCQGRELLLLHPTTLRACSCVEVLKDGTHPSCAPFAVLACRCGRG